MAGEELLFDCETNGLLQEMDRVHSIQLGTVAGDDADVYCDALPGYLPMEQGLNRIHAAKKLIGHNVIGFDYEAINKVYPGTLRPEQMVDTLAMVRLRYPERKNHQLRTWGEELGVAKGDFKGPWDVCTHEMMDYARQDVPVTRAVYHHVKEVLEWGTALENELYALWLISAQERNGFGFDEKAAQLLDAETRGHLAEIEAELRNTWFPPIERTHTFTPKVNRKDLGYVKGVPFTKRWIEEFNPGSRAHIAERLQLLGWKPKAYGKDGIPTVDEKVLGQMKHPVAAKLLEYLSTQKRLGMLSDGTNGWLKMVKPDGRIYGRVNTCGAITGRMTHSKPNVAQADSSHEMRALWIPRPGFKLVGCDAEGAQARGLGHYLTPWDKGAFSDRVVNGDKKLRTDVHSANLKALVDNSILTPVFWGDCFDEGRDGAKTILYALIFGAGDWKLGETIRQICRDAKQPLPRTPSKELGILVRMALSKSMVGFDKLVAAVKKRTKDPGYVTGLDGRRIYIRSEHSALNMLLQGFEAVVMKVAAKIFWQRYGHLCGIEWMPCANVHDEVQIEVPDRDGLPEKYGQAFADAIRDAGVALNVRCDMAGSFDVGLSWAETH